MELRDVMNLQNIVVVGNTINEEKYAYKIKHALLEKGYNVMSVGKELQSINDVEFDIEEYIVEDKSSFETIIKEREIIKKLPKTGF